MIIYPSAFPVKFGYFHWEHLNRVRAIDNQMYILGVAQARNDLVVDFEHYGRSMLVDYSGKVVARAGDDEEFVYFWLNFEELEAYRQKFNLFAHKRHDIYETFYKY